MRTSIAITAAAWMMCLATAGHADELTMVPRCFDGDGFKEAQVFYNGKMIEKVLIDADQDGVAESRIDYKNGLRESAVWDSDKNGKVDTWISYYFTGIPWKVAEDTDGDGRADLWKYLKNGVMYKWEKDRNGDGKADLVTVVFIDKPRLAQAGRQLAERKYDDNYDGRYDKPVQFYMKKPPARSWGQQFLGVAS